MPVYEVQGTERESGVHTTIPIEAKTRGEAMRQAQEQGIADAQITGENEDHPSAEAGTMPAEELIEKTSTSIRPRVMWAWIILLFIWPAVIGGLHLLGGPAEVPMSALLVADVLVSIVFIVWAVMLLRRYWS